MNTQSSNLPPAHTFSVRTRGPHQRELAVVTLVFPVISRLPERRRQVERGIRRKLTALAKPLAQKPLSLVVLVTDERGAYNEGRAEPFLNVGAVNRGLLVVVGPTLPEKSEALAKGRRLSPSRFAVARSRDELPEAAASVAENWLAAT